MNRQHDRMATSPPGSDGSNADQSDRAERSYRADQSDRVADTPITSHPVTPSRREFLARSAAIAAGAGAFGALHADDVAADELPVGRAMSPVPISPFEPVRMAVIGTGGMGTEHCNAFMRQVPFSSAATTTAIFRSPRL